MGEVSSMIMSAGNIPRGLKGTFKQAVLHRSGNQPQPRNVFDPILINQPVYSFGGAGCSPPEKKKKKKLGLILFGATLSGQ